MTEQSILFLIDGREEAAPWSSVTGISAGLVRRGRGDEQRVFVLALEANPDGKSRVFLLAEIEPAWVPVTNLLHITLPGIAPFDVWGAELVNATAPIELWPPDNKTVV